MSPHVLIAKITASLRLATAATLVGGPLPQKILIYELQDIRYATHLGSPSHPVSPLPLVALSVLSDETAPPPQSLCTPQGLCKGCQTPLDTDGSLRRKMIRSGWTSQVWCPTCASRNKNTRQQRQNS